MFTLTVCPLWFESDIYGNFADAAARGFKALEVLNWIGLDLNRIRSEVDRTGVEISAISCRSTDPAKQKMIANQHGIVNADSHAAFLDAIKETIAAAKIVGTKNIVVLTGNEVVGLSRQEQHTNIVKALHAAAPLVEEAGMTIMLEPLNILVNHKGYFLTTTEESVEIIQEVGSPNVLVLYDIYHQQITEGNIINNIRNNISSIGHIHVGDVPGRKQPGTGEINYRNVFKAIRDVGFEGYVVFECRLTEDVDLVSPKMWALLEDE